MWVTTEIAQNAGVYARSFGFLKTRRRWVSSVPRAIEKQTDQHLSTAEKRFAQPRQEKTRCS